MKLKELLVELNKLAENPENLEKPIQVSIYTGLATCPAVDIKSVSWGFDWGHGRLFIHPMTELIDRKHAHVHCKFLPEFLCPLRSPFLFEYGDLK